jgi:hypothetical protein
MTELNHIRINELARELEVRAQAIIEYLPEVGVTEKKGHSSSIDFSTAVKVRKHFRELAEGEADAQEEPASDGEVNEAANRVSLMTPTVVSLPISTRPASLIPHSAAERFAVANEENPGRGKMGLNWLWYAPLVIWVCVYYGMDNSIHAYRNFRTIFQFPHYWVLLFSPSAYLFAFASLLNVWTPTVMAFMIPMYFTAEMSDALYKKRYRWAVLTIFGVIASGMITAAIIWGSFPFEVSPDGELVMRMIPFLPWPHHPPVQ